MLLRAWTGERFSYAGRHYRVSEVELNVRPVQQPRPPIWIATLRADRAAYIGARGFPVMLIPYASAETVDEMTAGLAAYRAAFVEAGRAARERHGSLRLPLPLCGDHSPGPEQAREPMERYVRTRLYAVQRPFETLVEQDVVAFGDPEEIVRVARRYEAAGFTDFLAIPNFGGLPAQAGAALDGADGPARPAALRPLSPGRAGSGNERARPDVTLPGLAS